MIALSSNRGFLKDLSSHKLSTLAMRKKMVSRKSHATGIFVNTLLYLSECFAVVLMRNRSRCDRDDFPHGNTPCAHNTSTSYHSPDSIGSEPQPFANGLVRKKGYPYGNGIGC